MRHLALFIGAAAAFAPPHAVVARQACVVQGEECTHEGIEAYAAVQFEQTKPSLRTFLKLWLMGGPVRGWRGVGNPGRGRRTQDRLPAGRDRRRVPRYCLVGRPFPHLRCWIRFNRGFFPDRKAQQDHA